MCECLFEFIENMWMEMCKCKYIFIHNDFILYFCGNTVCELECLHAVYTELI